MSLRIIFMGTPDFAVPPLRALHEAGHEVVAVYTQPPRPKGRGQNLQKSPVHLYADAHNIPVFHPETLRPAAAQDTFQSHKADVAVVAAYGLLLPEGVLAAPLHGCINIHASLLPRWRGAAPIQYALLAGDSETGVTLMQMDRGLDTGAIIAMESFPIDARADAAQLYDRLSVLGAAMIVRCLRDLETKGSLPSTPQGEDFTYAPLLKKEDGLIVWSQDSGTIDRKIRALNPWPGCFGFVNGRRIKMLKAQPINRAFQDLNPAMAGTLLDGDGHVLCGDGTILRLETLQPEGKKSMDARAAINGGYMKAGDIFT